MSTLRVTAVLVVLILLAACSAPAATQTYQDSSRESKTIAVTRVVEQAAMPYNLPSGGEAAGFISPATMPPLALGAPEAEQAREFTDKSDVTIATPSPLVFAEPGSGLVIKDAEMDLVVDDVARSLARLTQLAADHGGYLINSEVSRDGGFAFALVRLAVPVQNFERALNAVRQLALRVERERASGQDVTAEYTDLQSQLTNLEATAARVREFLKDARTVEESLRINQQLSELEGQIERVKGQLRYYAGRAAFSTLTVTLRPETPTPTPTPTPTNTPTPTPTPTATPTPPWQPGKTFDAASSVLIAVLQNVIDVTIWVVVVGGPFVLLGGVLLGAGRLIQRRLK
jgi:TolA-binding protein